MANEINKEYLEGNGDFAERLPVDLTVLDEAEKYHIDKNGLETVSEIQMSTDVKRNTSLSQNLWAKMDVNLGEMAKNIFETSERFISVVCDDKVVYLNKKARMILELGDFHQSSEESFFNFVDPQDWNLLADNIGEMLMEQKKVNIRLKTLHQKNVPVDFSAVYLPDTSHFSFILIGSILQKPEKNIVNPLYDADTGLPNFFLFEDRVQMAVNIEKDKSPSEGCKIAVLAVSVDNMDVFVSLKAEGLLYKKLSYSLAMELDKKCTVARGLKYPFWILIPGLADDGALKAYIAKVKNVLNAGVSDNFNTYDIAYSLGVSVFPTSASSAKKLVQSTIQALEQARKEKGSAVVQL